jgi:hypothetical protein
MYRLIRLKISSPVVWVGEGTYAFPLQLNFYFLYVSHRKDYKQNSKTGDVIGSAILHNKTPTAFN